MPNYSSGGWRALDHLLKPKDERARVVAAARVRHEAASPPRIKAGSTARAATTPTPPSRRPQRDLATAAAGGVLVGASSSEALHRRRQAGQGISKQEAPMRGVFVPISKADTYPNGQPKASTGRLVAGTLAGGTHSLFAAKKGKKLSTSLETGGAALGGNIAGRVAGGVTAAALHKSPATIKTASAIGGLAGMYPVTNAMTRRNQRLGRYKPQVSKAMSLPFSPVHAIQPRTAGGQFASHANDFTRSHGRNLSSRRGTLVEAHGKSGLAPAHTSRQRNPQANGKVPNGSAHGRRLA